MDILTRLKIPLGWEINILTRKSILKATNIEKRRINVENIKNKHVDRIKLAQA
jgi:hypothetical protein